MSIEFLSIIFVNTIIFIHLLGFGIKAMESNDDGLFNRFLISVGFKRKPIRDCPPPDNKTPKLVHLFYYTYQLHKQQQEYSFNQDGIPLPFSNFNPLVFSISLRFYEGNKLCI